LETYALEVSGEIQAKESNSNSSETEEAKEELGLSLSFGCTLLYSDGVIEKLFLISNYAVKVYLLYEINKYNFTFQMLLVLIRPFI
jgi:hypothetical protein